MNFAQDFLVFIDVIVMCDSDLIDVEIPFRIINRFSLRGVLDSSG